MDPHSGEVTIKLLQKEIVLKPTLSAAMAISTKFGGFAPVVTNLLNLHLPTMAYVIHHGCGREKGRPEDLNEKIWMTGTLNLASDLTTYVTMLSNGGRPIEDRKGEEDEDESEESEEGNASAP